MDDLVADRNDAFAERHIGPRAAEVEAMLSVVGAGSLQELATQTVPAQIRITAPMELPPAMDEAALLAELRELGHRNVLKKSLIGMGYAGTHTPPVIQRNVLENPGWYTAYTPYQAEISQGRLEAILNFQTVVTDLTGMEIANASLLDEATAAAEAVQMARAVAKTKSNVVAVCADVHPQVLAVIRTRAWPLGWNVQEFTGPAPDAFAVVFAYPGTTGEIRDLSAGIAAARKAGALAIVCADLLALTLLRPPGEMGADVVVGAAQRFGVPMGFGGPHAGFFATRDMYKRQMPGRLVGVSVDAAGAKALRLALQTREQHIRREKATSNICTAQVLLAVMAGFFAVWHGPEGLTRIARRINAQARFLANAARAGGFSIRHERFFDTIAVQCGARAAAILKEARAAGFNLRRIDPGCVGITLDETVTQDELEALAGIFGGGSERADASIPEALARKSRFLTAPVFSEHRSETRMMRYLKRLEDKDIALNRSMIPLGSCTMKLNAAAEMAAVSWPEFAGLHPFAPADQTRGYKELIDRLCRYLMAVTGFAGVSLQPNSGAQGEFAGLLAIRAWQEARGEAGRDVCLIPSSAHGTNPASATMAGYRVVVVGCDGDGNVDVGDLHAKIAAHADRLAALMITYPSTHGVFEAGVRDICDAVHAAGGQVYMDGANMNAQVGLTSPAAIGADVCHLNLHKTFCIPHGGGGPGVGPIGVAAHLLPHLPNHPLRADAGPASGYGPVSAAPFGSALILAIPYAYLRMMGAAGITRATEIAILNANYVAARLAPHYPILFRGQNGRVAHECIVDCRGFAASAGVQVEDIAKRLQDYGFHAPTMSWPVAGTLMIEPTESEDLAEMDRFCDAMIGIAGEIGEIAAGRQPRDDNLLKNAPHTAAAVMASEWRHPYSREQAAFPLPFVAAAKFWPPVRRVDNVYGDRNLVCTCAPLADYAEAAE